MKQLSALILMACIFAVPAKAEEVIFLYTEGVNNSLTSSTLLVSPTSANQFPSGRSTISTFDLGPISSYPFWDIGSFTGFRVPKNSYPPKELAGNSLGFSSAVQFDKNTVGMLLNTYSSPYHPTRPIQTMNYGVVWKGNDQALPWGDIWKYGNNAKVCLAFFASIPVSFNGNYGYGGSVNYAGAYFFLTDKLTNQFFVFSADFYRSMDAYVVGEGLRFDDDGSGGGVMSPQVLSYIGSQGWIKTLPWSAVHRRHTWFDDQWFGFCIEKPDMERALQTIRKTYPNFNGLDINRLQISTAAVGAEIYTGPGQQYNGYMAMRIHQLNVFIMKP